jgi:hypothetical protein
VWPSGSGKGLQNPVPRFNSGHRLHPFAYDRGTRARSSAGEHFPDTEGVTGSNPVAPTSKPLTSGNAGQFAVRSRFQGLCTGWTPLIVTVLTS